MTKTYDALIIGGGHNGLTCAFYLAKAGMRVRVLERRHVVGAAEAAERRQVVPAGGRFNPWHRDRQAGRRLGALFHER